MLQGELHLYLYHVRQLLEHCKWSCHKLVPVSQLNYLPYNVVINLSHPDVAQYVSMFIADVVMVFVCFDGFPDDLGTVNLGAC
jgi:hypothetical protein